MPLQANGSVPTKIEEAPLRKLPECWGHRGASARFPENTLASFEAAIRDGADGVESDVHVSKDDVVIMFHDPTLDRTTNYKGAIKEMNWHGAGGMHLARTVKEPRQAIPTFTQTVDLLMMPENQHVKFNIDVKPMNDPERLFKLIHDAISSQDSWETKLAPRLVLGLWHPKFLEPAKRILPYCTRSSISFSLWLTRDWMWDDVEYVSVFFKSLATWSGKRFLRDAKAAGKKVLVFTVNEPDHLIECSRWGVDVIITDTTNRWLNYRKLLQDDYKKTLQRQSRLFLWLSPTFYLPFMLFLHYLAYHLLIKFGGPFGKNKKI